MGRTVDFEGTDELEQAIMKVINKDKSPSLNVSDVIIKVQPRYYLHTEEEILLGSPTKVKKKLGWAPKITAQEICTEMVEGSLTKERRQTLLNRVGITLTSLEDVY